MAWASKRIVIPGCIAFAIWWVLAVFPRVRLLPIGRTAGSLVGAVLMVVSQVISPTAAFAAVDLSILGLLFGTMVISIYLERADLFRYLGHALEWRSRGGKDLLCRVCLLAAISSALFTNDTTCVLLTGFVLKICREKKLSPHPFLMALATSSNIGSSATSIGNPQNLVIAVQGNIGFGTFLIGILPAMLVGMIVNTILLLVFYWRVLESRVPEPSNTAANSDIGVDSTLPQQVTWNGLTGIPMQLSGPARRSHELENMEHGYSLHIALPNQGPAEPHSESALPSQSSRSERHDPNRGDPYASGSSPARPDNMTTSNSTPASEEVIRIPFTHRVIQRRPIWKFSVYLVALGMLAALLGGLNLAWTAITAAIVLTVLDFRDASPSLDKVSYALLVFFSGMFITVEGFNLTGAPEVLWTAVEPHAQINTTSGVAVLSLIVTLLSNVASNVPTVLLLGPRLAISSAATAGVSVTKAWLILAWVSTVAGNLTLIGSAANVIVAEQARRTQVTTGFNLSFLNHLWYGFPSTLVVIAVGLPLIRG